MPESLRVMFAKPPPPRPIVAARPNKPARTGAPIAAAGAVMMFGCAAAILVAVTGDPKAGTPTVRLAVAHIGEVSGGPTTWSDVSIPSDPNGPVRTDDVAVDLTTAPETVADAGPMDGQAVITLPGVDGVSHAFSSGGLAQSPIAGLFLQRPGGDLPIIAPDGRTAAMAYARPFTPNGKPRVALVIGGLGLNAKSTRQAIDSLPPEVTLSFAPYADGLQGWIDMARAAGHEVLLETPMEPKDYPENDPGPYTLMADSRADETVHRLEWLLSRATGYFGVTNYLGSKFTASPTAMNTFAGALRSRGLAFIDDGTAARAGGGIPRASADRIIDDQLSADAIDRQFAALETQATRTGRALGSGFAYPVTLEEAAKWASALSAHGFQLAPASAVMVQR
ncbi:MAG TPA: divergent polysaccharide deacetylase family protein [Caulobacteraceae bacterium]|nr:divergent polysaccharide deacetylase family protein [Caulobacteraceae bacterium]